MNSDRKPLEGIDVLILAGGLGSRLRDALPGRQKVTAEIQGRPFVDYLIDQFVREGARHIILAAGHLSSQVESLAQRPRGDGVVVYVSIEPEPLGTAGAIVYARSKFTSDTVLVANGDSFADIDIAALMAFHKEKKAVLTLSLITVDDGGRYGAVETDEQQRITEFREKQPTTGAVNINAGVYVFERTLIDELEEGRQLSLELDVLPSLIGQEVYAQRHQASFIDIGTPETLEKATAFFDKLSKA